MPILYSVESGVARITLNRPKKRNALSPELIAALSEALAQSARDGSVRVALLAGAGQDFCSGADLAALDRTAEAGVFDHLDAARAIAEVFLAMRRHPRPIVAAVRGRALAGGCGLATACDLILASESALFGYPEVKIGFIPAMVMAMLRRSVSEKRAFELVTLGAEFSAEEAAGLGLVNHVFDDEVFEGEVERFALQFEKVSRSAVSLSKQLLYQIDGMSFENALDSGADLNVIARLTADCRRGVAAFLKKR